MTAEWETLQERFDGFDSEEPKARPTNDAADIAARVAHESRVLSQVELPLDSLGSPWYAAPRLSRRLFVAQI